MSSVSGGNHSTSILNGKRTPYITSAIHFIDDFLLAGKDTRLGLKSIASLVLRATLFPFLVCSASATHFIYDDEEFPSSRHLKDLEEMTKEKEGEETESSKILRFVKRNSLTVFPI